MLQLHDTGQNSSCRLLDINMCIPYPVEPTKPGRLAVMPTGWPSKLADKMNPTRSNRLTWMPSDRLNNIDIDNETPAERQAWLEAIRLAQQQRSGNETPDERQARLEAVRLTQQERRDISIAIPLVPSYSHHCVSPTHAYFLLLYLCSLVALAPQMLCILLVIMMTK